MKKVFMIDGGAGRVICAIPALEKYVTENPNDDVTILLHGWDNVMWSNPILQNISFNAFDKGVFNRFLKNADSVIIPEPYKLPKFYNQQISLIEAFDLEINGNISCQNFANLYLTQEERVKGKRIVSEAKGFQGKNKTVVIHPFGSAARLDIVDGVKHIYDSSRRSMDFSLYYTIAQNLSQKYNVILLSDERFHLEEDIFSYKLKGDLRDIMTVINTADYFIGCDSVGQHMARSFQIPGTVIFGATFPENFSYPDWFNIIDKDKNQRVYNPWRLSNIDMHLADRTNENCMDYSDDVENVLDNILSHLKYYTESK